MKNQIQIIVHDNGLSAFRKEFNALIRDMRRVDGKKFSYTLEFQEPSAGSMSQFKPISRARVAEGLKRAHRDTKPQIYSDRLANGGPFRQRVDVMVDYLASAGNRDVVRTRREAQVRFAEADGRIFKTDTGQLGKTLSHATRSQIEKHLDRLFG